MKFSDPLISAILVKRYKRFLADLILTDGNQITAHCPNSGSMMQCATQGWKAAISPANSATRKTKFTWEMVHNGNCWIGINTHLANDLAEEAVQSGVISQLQGYEILKREVRYGKNSRIDLLLENSIEKCYVEVKNVTLLNDRGNYTFPDSITTRGRKHLHELISMKKDGHRAVMLFVIQRSDGKDFTPAEDIDPEYAKALTLASEAGVEILAYCTEISPNEIIITKQVKVI